MPPRLTDPLHRPRSGGLHKACILAPEVARYEGGRETGTRALKSEACGYAGREEVGAVEGREEKGGEESRTGREKEKEKGASDGGTCVAQ